jgi:pimeloyl-ACP methyl ester carboxylesterase
LKKDLAEMARTAAITVKVKSDYSENKPVIIGIFKDDQTGKVLLDYRVFAGPTLFAFLVPFGHYDVVAYQDLDGSGKYELGEPASVRDVDKLDNENRERIILQLDAAFRPSHKQLQNFRNAEWKIEKNLPLSFGKLADLSNPIFSSEFGGKGFWEPLQFAKKAGVGIYFMEEYSPEKTPVLFVSGAFGYPLGWKAFMEGIDREKYQAWYYLYPSGLRIDRSAGALADVLKEVHTIYGFKNINIVAHSMGGLVAYRSIQITQEKQYGDYVNLIISISTPWAGHDMAAKGVKYSPAIVPCWIDMDPGSVFIKNLFDNDILCDHHLWFSFTGDTITINENNDGTVSIHSQLRKEAQNKAIQVFGFNEDHNSILESEDVIEHLNRTMERYE